MEDFVNDDAQWEEEESYVRYFSEEKKVIHELISLWKKRDRFVVVVKK
jgi:acid phosphatase class B